MASDRNVDNLMRLMNFPQSMRERTADVCRTSDGHYLRMEEGDIGFNHFLGQPAPPHPGPGRENMLRAWRAMSDGDRRGAIAAAVARGINLAREFGVPTSDIPAFEVVAR